MEHISSYVYSMNTELWLYNNWYLIQYIHIYWTSILYSFVAMFCKVAAVLSHFIPFSFFFIIITSFMVFIILLFNLFFFY